MVSIGKLYVPARQRLRRPWLTLRRGEFVEGTSVQAGKTGDRHSKASYFVYVK
jgi:hypothetical protein